MQHMVLGLVVNYQSDQEYIEREREHVTAIRMVHDLCNDIHVWMSLWNVLALMQHTLALLWYTCACTHGMAGLGCNVHVLQWPPNMNIITNVNRTNSCYTQHIRGSTLYLPLLYILLVRRGRRYWGKLLTLGYYPLGRWPGYFGIEHEGQAKLDT